MEIKNFDEKNFKECNSFGEIGDKYSAGQVTIIGGSKLFHGAPILALKGCSRIVSMTYFSTLEDDKEVADKIKANLSSFVWVGREEIDSYIAKSDAVLIGPGLMRSHVKEQGFVCDTEGMETRRLSVEMFKKFPEKKWVIDGGTLQVVTVRDIPKGSVVTPNRKEFEMLFGEPMKEKIEERATQIYSLAKKWNIIVLTKDSVGLVSDGKIVWKIEGGNEGLVKGGVGDVMAGLTVGLMAKNDSVFAACAATLLTKRAAEILEEENGFMFNADDLVEMVPKVYKKIISRL